VSLLLSQLVRQVSVLLSRVSVLSIWLFYATARAIVESELGHSNKSVLSIYQNP
jgi:hypothetical protein